MENKTPKLISTEVTSNLPILIIDKKGILGNELASKLKEQFLIVLVSGKEIEFHENVIHLPYRKKIPLIPDNKYSHTFIFYSGEESILAMLPSIMKKANETNGKVFFLTSLIFSSEKLFRRLSNHLYHSMGVLLYGEVFDEKIRYANMVNLYIYQAKKNGRLLIPGDGLGKLYPVYISDLLVVIIAAAFSNEFKRGNLFIFPKHPFTEISVARVFQSLNPDLRIDFNKKKEKSVDYYIPQEGTFVFGSYKLEQSLRKMNLSMFTKKPNTEIKLEPKPVEKSNYKFLGFFKWLFIILIAPIVVVIITGIIALASMWLSLNRAESGNFQQAEAISKVGKFSISTARVVAINYFPGDILIPDLKGEIVEKLMIGEQLSDIEVNLFASFNTFSNIYGGLSKDPKSDFNTSAANLKSTLLKLDEMKAQDELPENIKSKLDENSYLIALFENSVDTLSPILGFEGKRKYLVLFQNNMELRPGGGFIGSYGILEIENGKFDKFNIHDVYEADGKLKVHIEPPFGLKRYGGVTHFFLRDSNFDTDFRTNAAASADILQRETGERTDGVIAVDTNFVKNILSVLGTVNVDDYKEQVNVENFYMLTQKHAEDNFFPGSTQKKDFLTALFKSMQSSVFDGKSFSFIRFTKAVEKSIKEKHLLYVFAEPEIQKVFTVNNLSGSLWDGRTGDENSILDFFATIDANIGANKSNYYLKRSISQNVTINDAGQTKASASILYENTSTEKSVFGGDYKNYVRFVLPSGADLKSVHIDDKEVPIRPAIIDPSLFTFKGFVPPRELEIESSRVEEKEVVAFFLIVPKSSAKKVTISYTIPQLINTSSSEFSYYLRVFKQAGTDQDPYTLTLSYPTKFQPVNPSKNIVNLGGKLIYETKLSEDKNIKIKFSQK